MLPEFFMLVLHDLIHSSRVHQDFVGGAQVSFFLHLKVQLILHFLLKWSFAFLRSSQLSNHFRLWSVITLWSWDVTYKTTTSLFFRCWFSQQLHSIFSCKVAFYFIRGTSCHFLLRSFHSTLSILSGGFVSCLHQVSFHPLKLVFYSSMFQPECCLNPFSLIRFLSRSNRSGFVVYLILWVFDSRHSRRSSLLLESSQFFASSLEFLFHLIPFPSVSVLRSRDEISC